MIHWRLEGCPRCGGDVLVDGDESQCLQCGFEREEATEPPPVQAQPRPRPRIATGRLAPIGRPSEKAEHASRDAEIRRLRGDGYPLEQIGRRFSLSMGHVSNIARGKA